MSREQRDALDEMLRGSPLNLGGDLDQRELIGLARRLSDPWLTAAQHRTRVTSWCPDGDLGAGTTSLLAQAHPESVVGIHLLAVADPADVDPATVTSEEHAYLDDLATWQCDEGAYEHQQQTRPLSLAYGLSDSPTELLGWILEKYQAWTDNDGDLRSAFSDDFVLTQASLYCSPTRSRPRSGPTGSTDEPETLR